MNEIKPGDVVRHVLHSKYPRTARVVRLYTMAIEGLDGRVLQREPVAILDGIIRDIDHYQHDDPNKGFWEFLSDWEVGE